MGKVCGGGLVCLRIHLGLGVWPERTQEMHYDKYRLMIMLRIQLLLLLLLPRSAVRLVQDQIVLGRHAAVRSRWQILRFTVYVFGHSGRWRRCARHRHAVASEGHHGRFDRPVSGGRAAWGG